MTRHAETIATLDHVIEVLEADAPMTLRQGYYALIARGIVVKDSGGSKAAYKRLSRIVTDARERGDIDWSDIVDNVRVVLRSRRYADARSGLEDFAATYRRQLMANQDVMLQVWAESDSIGSVLAQTADRYGVPTFVGRGFASAGYVWSAARDIADALRDGKGVRILQVGDYDPSGEGIFRDVRDRLLTYARAAHYDASVRTIQTMTRQTNDEFAALYDIEVVRLALTPEQIASHGLQMMAITATSDSRLAAFGGTGTVEVEALPKRALVDILRSSIEGHIDARALQVSLLAEESERSIFASIAATTTFGDTSRNPGGAAS